MNQPNAMTEAMANAGITQSVDYETLPTFFASQRLAQAVGFSLSALYGMAATRLMKIANPARGTNPEQLSAMRDEVKEILRKLAWGIDNLGDHMREREEAIFEWAAGGFSQAPSDKDVEQVSTALGISKEQAQLTAQANRMNRTNYLAVRRQGLAEPMMAIIERELGKIEEDETIAPDDETIEKAAQRTFQNAVMWGDWTEAFLVKSDMVYHLGKSPELPALDQSMTDKAERIRAELSRRQSEQAAADAAALLAFDLDNLAA